MLQVMIIDSKERNFHIHFFSIYGDFVTFLYKHSHSILYVDSQGYLTINYNSCIFMFHSNIH